MVRHMQARLDPGLRRDDVICVQAGIQTRKTIAWLCFQLSRKNSRARSLYRGLSMNALQVFVQESDSRPRCALSILPAFGPLFLPAFGTPLLPAFGRTLASRTIRL